MTYALCDAEDCRHHDGDDCTLESVSLQQQAESTLCCMDYEQCEDEEDERA